MATQRTAAAQRTSRNNAVRAKKQQPAMSEALAQPVEIARDYPITSALTVFGIGISVGAGILLWKSLRTPQSSTGYPYVDQLQGFAERIGKQVTEAVRKQLS